MQNWVEGGWSGEVYLHVIGVKMVVKAMSGHDLLETGYKGRRRGDTKSKCLCYVKLQDHHLILVISEISELVSELYECSIFQSVTTTNQNQKDSI